MHLPENIGHIGFGNVGLGHIGWFNNYHNYNHGGRSYRYVVYRNNRCYDEDWCGRSSRICFDHKYNEVRGQGGGGQAGGGRRVLLRLHMHGEHE
jgi:hypothetical protein